jgi:microcompartment protein CcmK/EutM
MRLGRICGTVVATVKAEEFASPKLLLVTNVDAQDPARTAISGDVYVAVDLIGAGDGEIVLIAEGSAARVHRGCADIPTDAAVVAIVDTTRVGTKTTYEKS